MIDITTGYMGLELKSPVIIGSSGLTNSIEKIIECEKYGAGAVVLKSLFEEQITIEATKAMGQVEPAYLYPEAEDYIRNYSRLHQIEEYLNLIKKAKKNVSIPLIASIHCFTPGEWSSFARKIEEAGADALELNVYILPSDSSQTGEQLESIYIKIIEKVKAEISIPIALKINYHFSGLANFVIKLSWTGIKGLVLFNRFFSPDIDIDTMKVMSTNVFSKPDEITIPLRWVALLSGSCQCDIAASTGVHDGKGVIKQILVGAKAVQIASVLYKQGLSHIQVMNNEIISWMEDNNFQKLDDFRGKMSYKNLENPVAFERVQFMKHFSGIE